MEWIGSNVVYEVSRNVSLPIARRITKHTENEQLVEHEEMAVWWEWITWGHFEIIVDMDENKTEKFKETWFYALYIFISNLVIIFGMIVWLGKAGVDGWEAFHSIIKIRIFCLKHPIDSGHFFSVRYKLPSMARVPLEMVAVAISAAPNR